MQNSSARERSYSPRHRERRTEGQDVRQRSRNHEVRKQSRHSGLQGPAKLLPFNQSLLTKHDLQRFWAIFANYLDIQKRLNIEDLSGSEVKGRWKSFIGKWNRGELARGWYDPMTLQQGDEKAALVPHERVRPEAHRHAQDGSKHTSRSSEDGDDELGPALPSTMVGMRQGPAIPNLQDLQHKREIDQEDLEDRKKQDRGQRKLERKAQAEKMNELAPRAEAGTRERQIEKRREAAASNRDFAQAKDADAIEVGDRDLMGDEGGIEGYKAKLKAQQRQKNEREIRKEEVLRARAAEREERLSAHREKEAKTMETLRMLAEQRYGSIP